MSKVLNLLQDDNNKDYLESRGYKITAAVPGDYDRSILYTAYHSEPFHFFEDYHLSKLCLKVDNHLDKNIK